MCYAMRQVKSPPAQSTSELPLTLFTCAARARRSACSRDPRDSGAIEVEPLSRGAGRISASTDNPCGVHALSVANTLHKFKG